MHGGAPSGGRRAQLWTRDLSSGAAWTAAPLDGGGAPAGARILRCPAPGGDAWLLLGPREVRVNGVPLDLGVRVLRDRDELRAGTRLAVVSLAEPPLVEPFPDVDGAALCPRCGRDILGGAAAVRCPRCRLWHHQTTDGPEALPCWTYTERCAGCAAPTALDAAPWAPEEP